MGRVGSRDGAGAARAVPNGRRGVRRSAVGLVPAAVVVLLAGCSGPGSGVSAKQGQGPTSGSPAATKALETTAGTVRAQVEALVKPALADSTARQVTVDDAGPCVVGEPGPWPQRWGYAVRLTLRATDARAAPGALRKQLAGQGWKITDYDTTAGALDFDARKGDAFVRITGEPNPTSLTVEGAGVCVTGDGKVLKG